MQRRLKGRSFGLLALVTALLYWTIFLTFQSAEHQFDPSPRLSKDILLGPEQNEVSLDRNIHSEVSKQRDVAVNHEVPSFELKPEAVKEETQNLGGEEAEDEALEGWAGERLTVSATDEEISEEELAMVNEKNSFEHRYFPDSRKPGEKYFFYQPSGGWGNQRLIMRWAMIVANAMNRTLAIAPLAPHSDIWSGYNQWQKHELLPADRVLDVAALDQAVDRGVVFLDDIPARVLDKAVNQTHMTAKVHVKGHYVNYFAKVKKLLVHKESEIREEWQDTPEDIVFWDRMSMWQCCVPDVSMDSIWYGKHVMFNAMFKTLARTLMAEFGKYNAVHVRRGDMTITKDRRTAEVYYRSHRLDAFDKSLPLYVATNEKDPAWFDAFSLPDRFTKLIFWKDLNQDLIKQILESFPNSMKGDIAGFIDMLICGNAVKWEGSRKSTFSAAISAIRIFPQLRTLNWDFPPKPSLRKKSLSGNAQEVKEEGEDLLIRAGVDDERP